MEDTGRIKKPLATAGAAIVFSPPAAGDAVAELVRTSAIDLAHIVMLHRQGLLETDAARTLLRAILGLRRTGFSALLGRPSPRGLYLLYEDHLTGLVGPDLGGRVHTARSRNDLKATEFALRLSRQTYGLMHDAVRLQAVLLGRARRHRCVVMPAYTQYQAAAPSTYGHYLLGVAAAFGRDIDALGQAMRGLETCPLGACGAVGTDLPIDTALTARLLGFERPVRHSLDAVASRDAALHILASACVLAVTLSRLATDLQVWSTGDFGLLEFPDDLVGSSSIMPQKRNPFLLEHVKGKAGQVLGAFTAATSTIKGTPFTNSVEAGTEGIAPVGEALRTARDSVVLSRLMVSGARPRPDRMHAAVTTGWTFATAAANQLVRAGVPFREAHHAVGAAITAAAETGEAPGPAALRARLDGGLDGDLGPQVIVANTEYGGGPGPRSFEAAFEPTLEQWRAQTRLLATWRERGAEAAARLATAVGAVTGAEIAPAEVDPAASTTLEHR